MRVTENRFEGNEGGDVSGHVHDTKAAVTAAAAAAGGKGPAPLADEVQSPHHRRRPLNSEPPLPRDKALNPSAPVCLEQSSLYQPLRGDGADSGAVFWRGEVTMTQ